MAMGRLTKKASGRDPTIYPEEQRVGEEILQRWIVELLRPLHCRFAPIVAASRRWALTGN